MSKTLITSADPVDALLHEQTLCWRGGQRVPVEHFLGRPGMDAEALLTLLYQEIVLRQECGETPQPEEYVARFPQLAAQIRAQFEVHQILHQPTLPDKLLPGAAAAKTLPEVTGFEVLAELGRGAMGVVFKARQQQLNRVVALKMILSGGQASSEEMQRFLAEAAVVAQLQHPNIVQIFETGMHNGSPFFLLEFVAGGNLAAKLGGTPLRPRVAAQLIAVLARGLQHAHTQGVVHRDLKPANVLLTADGVPKVADFGLAKYRSADVSLTLSGTILGTPPYMAPEQAQAKKDIGPAADIYSLGAILYECLTGRPPFQAATPVEILWLLVHTEPVPPSRLQPQLPRDLETICLKCLEKAPGRRYASAAALAKDLDHFLADEPIVARPVGPLEWTWRWCRRQPALAATGGGAALAVLLWLVTVTVAFFLVRDSRDAALALATENGQLASKEKEQRLAFAKLAEANGLLAHQEKIGRKQAERLAVQLRFEKAYGLCQENRAVGLLSLAQVLQTVYELEDAPLEASLRLHLGHESWRAHRLRGWVPHQPLGFGRVLSPDGKTELKSRGKAAQLWDVTSGKPISPLLPHQDQVLVMAVSPDGKTVLTGCNDKTAQLWDWTSGQPLGPSLKHPGPVITVAFSPDGKTLLTGGGSTAQLWALASVASGKPLGLPLQDPGGVIAVAFSPNGKTVLTGNLDKTAQLWAVASGKPLGPPLQHQGSVRAVAFSSDGNILLTGGDDRMVRLWDATSGQPLGFPLQHQDAIHAVAFGPDGKTVKAVMPSLDKTAQLWEVAGGRSLGLSLQHDWYVLGVAFSPNGKVVLTRSADKTVRRWDAASGKPLGRPMRHEGWVLAMAASPDGKTVLTGDGKAQLWDVTKGEPLGLPLPQDGVRVVAVSPDGKTLLTGSADKTARLWDRASGKLLGVPMHHGDAVVAVAFSPDGKTVLTGSADHKARLWDASSGKSLGPPLNHQAFVSTVAFSPDSKIALTGSFDKTARLWDVASSKPLPFHLQHADEVCAVAFSPDGKVVLTGSLDQTARLWEVASGKPLAPPLQHQGGVQAVAFSPDGKTVLTGSEDQMARLWEVVSGKPLGPPMPHQGKVMAVAFSPDGKTVLTGSADHKARLWQVPQPLAGDPKHLVLWTQVITGLELDEFGGVRILDAATWKQRRQRLQADTSPKRKRG